MGRIEKTVFISYRRTNVSWALSIYQDLTAHGYDVFFDYQSIDSGSFEKVIIENIKARAHFLAILTPSALERCKNPNDWLRKEIETAIDEKRNIVPLMLESFEFGTPLVEQSLTGKLSQLRNYNGLRVYSDYFFEGMEKLRRRFLSIALSDIQLQPLSTSTQEITTAQKEAANEFPKIETEQLKEADTALRREAIQKLIFEANVERYEQEKLNLAHDLHDSIFNQLAVFRYSLNVASLSPEAQKAYDELHHRLRELISGLRPPMLTYGLGPSIEELSSTLEERFQGTSKTKTEIQDEGNWRYPENIERHIYRIIQEAYTNALVHAKAKIIIIKVSLLRTRIEFTVEDDGVGFYFDLENNKNLEHLIFEKRFGIAGMFERANLINAKFDIFSKESKGTRVQLTWDAI